MRSRFTRFFCASTLSTFVTSRIDRSSSFGPSGVRWKRAQTCSDTLASPAGARAGTPGAGASWYASVAVIVRMRALRSSPCRVKSSPSAAKKRGHRRRVRVADVVDRVDEATSEEVAPHAVDDGAREPRILLRRHPLGEGRRVSAGRTDHRPLERHRDGERDGGDFRVLHEPRERPARSRRPARASAPWSVPDRSTSAACARSRPRSSGSPSASTSRSCGRGTAHTGSGRRGRASTRSPRGPAACPGT